MQVPQGRGHAPIFAELLQTHKFHNVKLELILKSSVLPEQAEQIGLPPDYWRRGGQTF